MIHFDLVTVNAARRDLDRRVAPVVRGRLIETVTANLHPGVQAFVRLQLQFENEIAVFLLRAKKTVRLAFDGRADDDAVRHGILRLAAALNPTVEVGAVENGLEIAGRDKRQIQLRRWRCER